MKTFKTILFMMLISFFFVSCTKHETSSPPVKSDLKAATIISSITPDEFTIIAGQNMTAGSVIFTETSGGLLVEYTLTGGWQLDAVHFWIGTDPTTYPQTKKGTPIPGQFPYVFENLGWVSYYSFTVPTANLSDWCNGAFYTLCHAALRKPKGNDTYNFQTGWTNGTPVGAAWAMMSYFSVEQVLTTTGGLLDCNLVPPSFDLADAITERSDLTLTYWYGTEQLISSVVTVEGIYTIKGTSPMGCIIEAEVVVGNKCGNPPPPPDDCWGGDETAWAAGPRYVPQGNWATYVIYYPHAGESYTVALLAGQTHSVGSVTLSPNGTNVNITIIMNSNARFNPTNENLKIEGYTSLPPAINPVPGNFTYKSNVLDPYKTITVTLPYYPYYGIHADTQTIIPCPL
jgi:hypothetical protein